MAADDGVVGLGVAVGWEGAAGLGLGDVADAEGVTSGLAQAPARRTSATTSTSGTGAAGLPLEGAFTRPFWACERPSAQDAGG